ncbi:MAG: NifB/NifX family molybdenum-iron cluster-binding protein [Deltaproteobacteria bacterium]|nr:NifB/NifX family molybdenum-iron cluster-binding protein [Deltaproteobacteria bacterium]MBW1921728.1 NifB/NifX family molybdenum-iron cluster-binding protein [Deltaproteobacteria bacterium]MBW1935497.1 NifB/NifX family molybdenum-iron cluster-binding protein [Deltaproteobacteria bacterium]MBW1978699.1 NifB/NifX family molybdenum-iron cluster-binding protein [Deltaproteobacteria bacterium]MBW2044196.1 NifB/NifX family molybdenum-iron cluster-binding protein [Deltaproteobacteria bacterium]
MKIAIPVWEGKISPVLDTASRLMIVEVEDKEVSSRLEIYLDEWDLTRRCLRIQNLGVDTLICGAVSRPFSRMLSASGVNLIAGISGPAEDVLNACLHGNLAHPRFLMPGFKKNLVRKNVKFLDSKMSEHKKSKEQTNGKFEA